MVRKVGMVHTVAKLVPMFEDLAEEVMPGTEVIHLVDEGLLKDIVAGGELTPDRVSRLASLASFAEASGAEAVMLTCSTVGPGVDTAKESVEIPFLKVDEAMADRAVELGPRIGVIATLHTTLTPTSDLVRDRASAQGRPVHVETVPVSGRVRGSRRWRYGYARPHRDRKPQGAYGPRRCRCARAGVDGPCCGAYVRRGEGRAHPVQPSAWCRAAAERVGWRVTLPASLRALLRFGRLRLEVETGHTGDFKGTCPFEKLIDYLGG